MRGGAGGVLQHPRRMDEARLEISPISRRRLGQQRVRSVPGRCRIVQLSYLPDSDRYGVESHTDQSTMYLSLLIYVALSHGELISILLAIAGMEALGVAIYRLDPPIPHA